MRLIDCFQVRGACRAILVATAALLATGANAQAVSDADLEQVVVTAQNSAEDAASVVLNRNELAHLGDASLLDALKRVPGITTKGSEIRLRGLGAGYTQILIDGDPAPTGFTLDSLSLDLVERIEVLKTPVADLGTQSIAGTLNIVLRKKPTRTAQAAKFGVAWRKGVPSTNGSLQASMGDDRLTLQLVASAAREGRRVPIFIRELQFDSGKLTADRRTFEPFAGDTYSYNFSPVLNWSAGRDAITWQIFAQRFATPFLYTMAERTVVGPPSDYPFSRWQNERSDRTLYRSNLSWKRALDKATLEARLNGSYQDRGVRFSFQGYDADDRFALDRQVLSAGIDRTLTARIKYERDLGRGHRASTGWDASVAQRDDQRVQHDSFSAPPGGTYDLDQRYSARVLKNALYLQDQWAPKPFWTAYLGLRVEAADLTAEGREFASVDSHSLIASPIAQVFWKLPYDRKDQVRFAISRTSRPPEPADLIPRRGTVNAGNGPSNPDRQGNPDLRSEDAWGLDLGFDANFRNGGQLNLSGYGRRISGVMGRTLFVDAGQWVTSLANVGTARTYGVELEVKTPVGGNPRDKSPLQVTGSLSANGSAVDSVPPPKNRLFSQTPLSGTFGLQYSPLRSLSLDVAFRFTAGYESRSTAEQWSVSGRTQSLDLGAAWQINAGSRIRLLLENVAHANETESSAYIVPTTSISRTYRTDYGLKGGLTFELAFND